jgi:hypothetical protein
VRRVDACRAALAQQAPARADDLGVLQTDVLGRREVAGEDRAVVEEQGDAVVGVPGRGEDLAGNADLREERPA